MPSTYVLMGGVAVANMAARLEAVSIVFGMHMVGSPSLRRTTFSERPGWAICHSLATVRAPVRAGVVGVLPCTMRPLTAAVTASICALFGPGSTAMGTLGIE